MQRARGRAQAAAVLRNDLASALRERLGLPPDLPVEALAGAVAARTGVNSERVLAVLAGPPPADEAELVALAQSIESLRREVTHVPERQPGAVPVG
jgi:hypothetical protein